GVAPVAGTIETAARPAAAEGQGSAPRLTQGGKHNAGIMWVEGHIDPAAVFVLVQDFLPRLAAIGGTEYAAFRVGTVGVAQGSDKNHIRVLRVDDYLA